MRDLVVELYDARIGTLAGTGSRFDFMAEPEAIERFGLDSTVLSLAVPLSPVAVGSRRARRQNYFAELLPEGRIRTRLAQVAGVAEHDVMGMLRAYGRDVAGVRCRSGTRRFLVSRGRRPSSRSVSPRLPRSSEMSRRSRSRTSRPAERPRSPACRRRSSWSGRRTAGPGRSTDTRPRT
ncbi:hypothetical protein ET495_06005 [Xylanimonas allomyrinae]|uniref:HipA N-terminal subdomain 1 domain-containing protein n=1 Tax=Xylanimonas allomyrinae TaxID=2509459 RepID=A0A4V0YE39_9MICO|nr:hypothetical protein ET495_06005 [Xylanimonas allomyrinae]